MTWGELAIIRGLIFSSCVDHCLPICTFCLVSSRIYLFLQISKAHALLHVQTSYVDGLCPFFDSLHCCFAALSSLAQFQDLPDETSLSGVSGLSLEKIKNQGRLSSESSSSFLSLQSQKMQSYWEHPTVWWECRFVSSSWKAF